MYSFASATTSLLGTKFSRRSVARTSCTFLSRLAREEASRRLGGAVVVVIRDLSEYLYFTPGGPSVVCNVATQISIGFFGVESERTVMLPLSAIYAARPVPPTSFPRED